MLTVRIASNGLELWTMSYGLYFVNSNYNQTLYLLLLFRLNCLVIKHYYINYTGFHDQKECLRDNKHDNNYIAPERYYINYMYCTCIVHVLYM